MSEELKAYLATLAALVAVFGLALAASAFAGLSNVEQFGLGTITGGLIGLLRMPRQHAPTMTADTVNAGTVNTAPGEPQ